MSLTARLSNSQETATLKERYTPEVLAYLVDQEPAAVPALREYVLMVTDHYRTYAGHLAALLEGEYYPELQQTVGSELQRCFFLAGSTALFQELLHSERWPAFTKEQVYAVALDRALLAGDLPLLQALPREEDDETNYCTE
jgi:hypothetical protein